MKKDLNITVVVIVLSCIYLFLANKYVTHNEIEDTSLDGYDVYNARVVKIDEINEETYDLGYSVLVGKTVKFTALVLNGDIKGETISVKQEISPFFAIQPEEVSEGDKILVSQSFNSSMTEIQMYDMLDYVRIDTITTLILIFFAGLIWFGRKKGILTIISLTFTFLSIFIVFIPSILNGFNIYLWSILTCSFIIVMTICIINGINYKSLSAIVGCLSGIFTSGILVVVLSGVLRLSGMIDEQSVFLQMLNPENPIDLKAIIFASIIIGAVGAIMDVATSIVSALSEIKEQNPEITFKKLYKSGVNIGQDILGTMTNTLILAYIGSSLSLVLLMIANTGSTAYLVNTESIIIEVVQSIIGSFGILLTLPCTSIITSYLYTKKMD